MANKDNLIRLVAQQLGPDKLEQMVNQAQQELGQDPDITLEVLDKIIQLFEYVAENPDEYQSVIQDAVRMGALDDGDLPPEFDPMVVAVMLIAFYGLRERMGSQPQMARGGLHCMARHLQARGRGDDTVLAHITPQEAQWLERRGGAGSVNPQTGLPEYGFFSSIWKGIKKIAKKVLPIAVSFVPGIQPLAAAALSALGTVALGGSLKEGALAGIGGALGTAGGMGFAGAIGDTMSKAVPGLSSLGLSSKVLGSAVLGGVTSGLAGKDPLVGALTAGATNYAAPKIADALNSYAPSAASVTDDMVRGANISAQMGADPLTGAATAGLIAAGKNLYDTGSLSGPTDAAGNVLPPMLETPPDPTTMVQLDDGSHVQYKDMVPGSAYEVVDPAAGGPPQAPATPDVSVAKAPDVSVAKAPARDIFKDAMLVGGVLSALRGPTTTTIKQPGLTPKQQAAMATGLRHYRFKHNMATLPPRGTPEWDRMMAEVYRGVEQTFLSPTLTAARGGRMNSRQQPQGALSQLSRVIQGSGTGRSDSIDARLSDGEYVVDAETVALLGDGSTRAGAAMLDLMRENIRRQKGRVLAQGKFSPAAKPPLAYMKGGAR